MGRELNALQLFSCKFKISHIYDYHSHLAKILNGASVEYFTILGTTLNFQYWDFRLCQVRIL
jgi:hypothetical protein